MFQYGLPPIVWWLIQGYEPWIGDIFEVFHQWEAKAMELCPTLGWIMLQQLFSLGYVDVSVQGRLWKESS